ncbi:Leo1-like protein-domain-containing protein [Phakopsora pachyrhizi]|uniref:Leo1-like protein-domain-containing protein n=1 Tax=Phakopsora pachyrhizi TaxID=170000 RepID=A0AAV0AHV9_PHAPC|nr:Leo1-like protein-domain-containing protein [Phakopsora pachyrhizi]
MESEREEETDDQGVRSNEHQHQQQEQGEDQDDQNNDLEEDLFGGEEDDDDEEEEEEERNGAKVSGRTREDFMDEEDDGEGLSEQEKLRRRELEYEEDRNLDGELGETKNLQVAEVTLPNLPLPNPSDGKVTKFLRLETAPFDEQSFLNGSDETEESDEVEKSNSTGNNTHLSDHNVIRWRWVRGEDGTMVKQSNSRVIRWSDGSQSLQVGSELFDMVYTFDNVQQQNRDNDPINQSAQSPGLTYLFARQFGPAFSEAQASITGQVSLRPYSLNSLTHRSLVASRGLNKSQRQTKTMVVLVDPEIQKSTKELEEAKMLKDLKKQEAKLARQQNRQANFNDSGPRAGLGADYEEEDYEEEMGEEEDEEEDYEDDQEAEKGDKGFNDREPELTELELADQKLELEQKKKKKRLSKGQPSSQGATGRAVGAGLGGGSSTNTGGYGQSDKVDEPKFVKKKLIIDSDDDE